MYVDVKGLTVIAIPASGMGSGPGREYRYRLVSDGLVLYVVTFVMATYLVLMMGWFERIDRFLLKLLDVEASEREVSL